MKKLTDDIKRMLNALAAQHAGDYLSMQDKMSVLGGQKSPSSTRKRRLAVARPAKPLRKVALLHDGQRHSAVLDFVIDACLRQGQPVKVDVLLHEKPQPLHLESMQQRFREANIDFEFRPLGASGFDEALDYLQSTNSLISVVAHPDDVIARRLIEQVLPGAGDRFYVPVVLIGGDQTVDVPHRSAA